MMTSKLKVLTPEERAARIAELAAEKARLEEEAALEASLKDALPSLGIARSRVALAAYEALRIDPIRRDPDESKRAAKAIDALETLDGREALHLDEVRRLRDEIRLEENGSQVLETRLEEVESFTRRLLDKVAERLNIWQEDERSRHDEVMRQLGV